MLNLNTPSHGHFTGDSVLENSSCDGAAPRQKITQQPIQQNSNQKILTLSKVPKSKSMPRPLSSIELDLLSALHTGASNRKIALQRGKSTYTVRNQLSTLYAKIGVKNRIQALVWLQTSTAALALMDESAADIEEPPKVVCDSNCLSLDLLNLHNIFGKPAVVPPLSSERDGCQISNQAADT